MTPRLRFGWGEDLPLQAVFPLGGVEGFPGLHLGERRGDREAHGSLLAKTPLNALLDLRLTAAIGRSAIGGLWIDDTGWLVGGRLGVGAETPVGSIIAEYGVASNGRGAAVVRVGRW